MNPQYPQWQQTLANLITDPHELLSLLDLKAEDIAWKWDKKFPLRVTHSFVNRMKKGDPNDPLLRQVLPLEQESQLSSGFSSDPLKESQSNPVPGLLHKYSSRVLLTFTSSCAIHCRFCFRRHFPYDENNPGRKGWPAILDYIANHPEIVEVILSGADPLMAQDEIIGEFIKKLEHIPHVQLLRFHTRLPVVIPERITVSFVKTIANSRFNTVMIYHINHPAEITPSIVKGVSLLKENNITVLNQTVLLKDVNDNIADLKELSFSLFKAGILPYYVHLLDPVEGASHFSVTQENASTLQLALRNSLPGYLVPQFVKEVPYEASKIPLDKLIHFKGHPCHE